MQENGHWTLITAYKNFSAIIFRQNFGTFHAFFILTFINNAKSLAGAAVLINHFEHGCNEQALNR